MATKIWRKAPRTPEQRLLDAIFLSDEGWEVVKEQDMGHQTLATTETFEDVSDFIDVRQAFAHSSWALRGKRFYSVDVTHQQLPADVYVAKEDDNGNKYFIKAPFLTDKLSNFPGTPIDLIQKQIQKFWKNKRKFEKVGFLHKRGILLYGAAGCGKTSIIKVVAEDVIAQNGIVVYVRDFSDTSEALKVFRQIEPDRPVLAIEEDIETHLSENHKTAREFLAFLDGENQIGNIVHIATTNKPDELEDRIIKRPGRFDLVIGINPPVKEARLMYLKGLLPDMEAKQIEELADKSAGLGFSHLRELVVCVDCLELDVKETLERLKQGVKTQIKQMKLGGGEAGLGFTVNFEKG